MKELIELQAIIPDTLRGQRLDSVLSQLFPDYSRACLQNWLKHEFILLDGKLQKQRYKVQGGEQIAITATLENQNTWQQAQAIALEIIYEDDAILIINKPVGMVVHPGAGNSSGTLLNALLHYLPQNQALARAGIIHRLDQNTSGLLIIAKTLIAQTELTRQMQAREIKRDYLALVSGLLTGSGTINQPIGRHPVHRTHMAVVTNGKHAVTHYKIQQRFAHHTLLKVSLETGRTHQIRVHLTYQGYPIVGDPVYGRKHIAKNLNVELRDALMAFNRQALHAYQLTLLHPLTQQSMTFTAELPQDMQQLLDLLAEEVT